MTATALDELADDHDRFLAQAREAAEQITAWQGRLVESIEGLVQTPCADPWRSYLAWALGLTRSESAELMELVDRLSELPMTREVLTSGERSMRTVLSIARRATPENEELILTSTEGFTGEQLARTLREWSRVIAPSERDVLNDEVDEPDDIDPPPSSASWCWRDGRFHLRADLDPADGAALQAWLEAERGQVTDANASEGGYVSTYERTCAEALVSLGERGVDHRTDDVGFAPESITTNIVIHAHEAADGSVAFDRGFIPGAGPVPEWALGMLAERGPVVTTVMLHGEPIMASVPDRFATADQRRALLARDGGCAYPGCGIARRLIAHHIRYYDDGGPTELRNMILLCRRHHRVVHRNEIRITPEQAGTDDRLLWRFADYDGVTVTPSRWAIAPPHRRRRLPTGRRRTGDGDPLTAFGLDVTIAAWLDHQERLLSSAA